MKAIARRLLHLPVLRFVDDYFAAESEVTAQHAMNSFARHVDSHCLLLLIVTNVFCRLVRALFGHDAISERKLEYGNPLTVLGIRIEVNAAGVIFQPDQEKA